MFGNNRDCREGRVFLFVRKADYLFIRGNKTGGKNEAERDVDAAS